MFDSVFDQWILVYAVVTAAITEMLIRYTPDCINRRRFGAIFSISVGFLVAGIHGCVLQYPFMRILWRGLLTVALSNFAYDHLKTLLGEFFTKKAS